MKKSKEEEEKTGVLMSAMYQWCLFLKHRKPLHFVKYSVKPVIHYSYVIYYLEDIHSTKGPLISGRAATFLKWVSHTLPTVVSSLCTLT